MVQILGISDEEIEKTWQSSTRPRKPRVRNDASLKLIRD